MTKYLQNFKKIKIQNIFLYTITKSFANKRHQFQHNFWLKEMPTDVCLWSDITKINNNKDNNKNSNK